MGIKDDRSEIKEWIAGRHFLGVSLRDRLDNFRWRLITVYGPANHDFSEEFIRELGDCSQSVLC